VARDARDSDDFLIIARTDARQSEGLDGVLRRMDAYAEAGADVFVAGSAVFNADDPDRAVKELRQLAQAAAGAAPPG